MMRDQRWQAKFSGFVSRWKQFLSLKNCRSVRICSVLNRSNRTTTVYYRLIFCAFSWPNMVKWHHSGIIMSVIMFKAHVTFKSPHIFAVFWGWFLWSQANKEVKLMKCTWYAVVQTARFLGVFRRNIASDISKFTEINDFWGVLKYHEPVFIPNTPTKPCCFLFILQGQEISHFT